MAYEWIPTILFGVLLLIVGFRLGPNGLIGLALVIGGVILIGWGLFSGWDQLTVGIESTSGGDIV